MSRLIVAGAKRAGRMARTSMAVVGGVATVALASFHFEGRRKEAEFASAKQRILMLPFDRLQLVDKHKNQFNLEDLEPRGGNPKEFEKIAVEDLVEIIHEATADPSIVAIYGQFGHGRSFQGGAADAEEVRTALRIFRESHRVHSEPNFDHKPATEPEKGGKSQRAMIAYADTFESGNSDYYLASIFTRIYLQKQGTLNLFGLGGSIPFFRQTLEKYGAKVHCYKHGPFKNAPNSFTHSGLSKEHRQNVENYMFAINGYQNAAINAGRFRADLPPDLWKLIQGSGSLTASVAQKMGLIDGIVDYSPLGGFLYSKEESEKPTVTQLGQYRQLLASRKKQKAKTAMLAKSLHNAATKLGTPAVNLLEGQSWYQKLLPEGTRLGDKETIALLTIKGGIDGKLVRKLMPAMEKIKKDKTVKCVVVRVDSPGGTIDASENILQTLKNLPNKPKVVVSFGNVAASGGYYVASHADTIFASQNTITGSIGVYGLRFDLSGVAEQYGVRFGHVSTGEFALANDPFSPVTRAQHANNAKGVDRAYERFREVVVTGRQLPDDYVQSLAEGRIWTGGQAKHNGLVDEVGGLSRAIEFARKNYTSGNAQVVDLCQDDGFFKQLGSWIVGEVQMDTGTSGPSGLGKHNISLPKLLPKKAFGIFMAMDENAAIRLLLESGSDAA